MKSKAYAIYDSKARVYTVPFFCQNDEVAGRNFASAVNDHNTQFGKYPEDFSLHCIGSYDDELGELKSFPPINLGLGPVFKTNQE